MKAVQKEMTLAIDRLEATLREAERELQHLNEQLQDKPDLSLGKGNTGGYSWEMSLARKERVVARIKAAREALTRVREGTYGRCNRCGGQIDPERLEILPATTRCAACARAARAPLTSAPAASAHATAQQ